MGRALPLRTVVTPDQGRSPSPTERVAVEGNGRMTMASSVLESRPHYNERLPGVFGEFGSGRSLQALWKRLSSLPPYQPNDLGSKSSALRTLALLPEARMRNSPLHSA